MGKVVENIYALIIVTVLMIISSPFIIAFMSMAQEGIINWEDDKTALQVTDTTMTGGNVYTGVKTYINSNGDAVEKMDSLIYDSEVSYSGLDILLSLYLTDSLNPDPSCVGFAKDLEAVNNLEFQVVELNDKFWVTNGKSTLSVFREDISKDKLIYNNLHDTIRNVGGVDKEVGYFNRMVYLPKGFKGTLAQDMWVYYHGDWIDTMSSPVN